MTKHILMLSAAAAALISAPAFAQTTISSSDTTVKKTTDTGDLTIATTGSVSVNQDATPVITLDSNNFVLNQGTIANTDHSGAIGVFVNATANPVVPTYGLSNLGNIILTGKGTGKIGIQLAGFGGTYTGNVFLDTTSNIQIAGDASIGVINDLGITTKGNIQLDGVMTITATDLTSTTSSDIVLVKQWGTLQGNLTIGQSAVFNAIGAGAVGIEVLGDIKPCDPAVTVCANDPTVGKGLLFNGGFVNVTGTLTPSGSKQNPEGAYALGIAADIADGVLNSGPINTSNTVNPASLIGNGVGVYPTVTINPTLLNGARAVTIGVFTTDNVDPGYSFYNRGNIIAQPVDVNLSATAISIAGSSASLKTTLGRTADQASLPADQVGGLFNSGLIQATAVSTNSATGAAVNATAISFEDYSVVPRLTVSGATITVAHSSLGQIFSSISGPKGGTARGVTISSHAEMPELNITQGGRIIVSAATSDTSISTLNALGVQDVSNTLKTINNSGTVSVTATTLDGGTQLARAIDLSASFGDNITINNSGTIVGDVLLGQAGNNHRLFVGNVGTVGTNTTTGFGTGGGAANSSTNIVNTPVATTSGANGVAVISGTIDFGAGGIASAPNVLHVGGFGVVSGKILSTGVLDVQVDTNGILTVQNTASTLRTRTLNINGGTLNLSVSQGTVSTVPIITATDSATIVSGSQVGLSFGSFISSSDPNNPVAQTFTLINATGATAINVNDAQILDYNTRLSSQIPYLFQSTSTPLSLSTDRHQLLLTLTPKSPADIGLTGSALTLFPYVNSALIKDPVLGAALINGVTNQATAQAAYAQFAPDVSGGVREVAITLTDQAAGPVAARQRNLRQYADQTGDLTLWGHEFAQSFNLKGVTNGAINAYKDRGFGFVLGMDTGSSQKGWYGAAFTFYTGDVAGVAPLTSKTHTQWYTLTGYTDWKGQHLFLDTQVIVGYGSLLGRRSVTLGGITRVAQGKRSALLGAIGATTGATFKYEGLSIVPHISLDGMTMREEKYTETGGGSGLNLSVGSYYASSLRTFIGTDIFGDIDMGLFSLRPEGRIGYRFDFLNNPVKLETQFVSTGTPFTLTGPDTGHGAYLAGVSLGASSETWSLGLNYDWLRGAHGSTTQIGTLSLLGRI